MDIGMLQGSELGVKTLCIYEMRPWSVHQNRSIFSLSLSLFRFTFYVSLNNLPYTCVNLSGVKIFTSTITTFFTQDYRYIYIRIHITVMLTSGKHFEWLILKNYENDLRDSNRKYTFFPLSYCVTWWLRKENNTLF